jgi:outer membrane protein assembly factor BamB
MKKVLALTAVIAACGGGANRPSLFATDWENDNGKSIEAARQKLGAAKPKANVDIAVGVAGNNDKLVGLPLGGSKWTFQHALDSRPTAVGGVVVASGAGETFAVDAATGKKLWGRPTGPMTVRGAGDDGQVTVVSLGQGTGAGMLLAVDRSGSVVRQVETDKPVGTPAVLAGHAIIPWAGQYLTVLDLANGDEVGRALVREKTSRVWTVGGAMYFGEVGIFRFDDSVKLASQNKTTHIGVPQREFPGNPSLLVPGDDSLKPTALAGDKVRLWARPASPDGPLSYDSNRFYATYFRIVLGFDTGSTKLAWVQNRPSDVIGAAAGAGSLVACDEQGNVIAYDATTGGTLAEMAFGEPLKSCVVSVDEWKASGGAKPVPALSEQIAPAILNRDSEMATGQRLLLRELAQLDDETATKTLVELASNPLTVPVLVEDSRGAIATRKNGTKYMLEALGKHYDFLKDVLRSPPVGPIAQALGNMKEKSAAPLLAAHLIDPNDTDDDVKRAAAALVSLADASQLPQLKEFFNMYRGAANNGDLLVAVQSVGEALLNAGGAEGRKVVEAGIADPMTIPDIKTRLVAVLQVADLAKQNKQPDPKQPPKK